MDGRILASFYMGENRAFFLEPPELKTVGIFPRSVNVGLAVVPKSLCGGRELFLVARLAGRRGENGGKALVCERRNGKLVPAELPAR